MDVDRNVLQHPGYCDDQKAFGSDQGGGLFVVQPLVQQVVMYVVAVR